MELPRLDNGSEYSATPDEVNTRACLDIKDQEPPLVLDQPGGRSHGRTRRHCLQMVHLDPRADGDRAQRQFREDGLRRGDFHQADHVRRGQDSG